MSDPLTLCFWGHGVSTPDDSSECEKRATRCVVLHQGEKEHECWFCPEHFRKIVHLTAPTVPKGTKGGGRHNRKD